MPHDLVQVRSLEELKSFSNFPEWAKQACLTAPFHVVRRAPQRDNLIPIGIRGNERSERFGTYIPQQFIETVISPKNIVEQMLWCNWQRQSQFPEFVIHLNQLSKLLSGLSWGIGGSLGYELITGRECLKPSSDVDIIWYQSTQPDLQFCQSLIQQTQHLSPRIDIQIENHHGAFHLSEYVQSPDRAILIKQNNGPILAKVLWDQ